MPAHEAWQRGLASARIAELEWETLRGLDHVPATDKELEAAIAGFHFQIRFCGGQVGSGCFQTLFFQQQFRTRKDSIELQLQTTRDGKMGP